MQELYKVTDAISIDTSCRNCIIMRVKTLLFLALTCLAAQALAGVANWEEQEEFEEQVELDEDEHDLALREKREADAAPDAAALVAAAPAAAPVAAPVEETPKPATKPKKKSSKKGGKKGAKKETGAAQEKAGKRKAAGASKPESGTAGEATKAKRLLKPIRRKNQNKQSD